MKHIDKDILYKYVLDLLESEDSEIIKNHLGICQTCSIKNDEIKEQIDLIGSYETDIELERVSRKGTPTINYFLKIAAVIIVGLTIGYSASQYIFKEHIIVVGQSFIPQTFVNDSLKFVACPSVDISTKY